MKRLLSVFLSAVMLATVSVLGIISGCGNTTTLRICNWEDYISVDEESGETLAEEFEQYYLDKTGQKIKVEYSTFGTCEELYNTLKIEGDVYDLICPSDYMIEKMAREDMLEKLELSIGGNYNKNLSPYIKSVFESIKWGENGENNLSQYAAGYMWGTMGLVYNSAKVSDNDMKSYSSLWNNDSFKNKFTIKDSVRDTYFICLAKVFENELKSLDKTAPDYNQKLTSYFNATDSSTIEKVRTALTTLKSRSKGMEVDSGKNDIVNGNIDVYFAWSGDAVYSMNEAETENVTLKYSVPEEGSNVWFDGWCIPKGSSQKALAQEFIDFISSTENAVKNMDYIGYVSCMAGDGIYDYVKQTYGVDNGVHSVDLSYFFSGEQVGDYVVKTNTLGRQFSAQYPSFDVINRCAVMSYFNDNANTKINEMWMAVKA